MSSEDRTDAARTKAAVRRSWWPGWIWAVPLAALLLVGWWGFRTLASGGKDITISFDDVHGLKEGSTTIVYRGMTVGKVSGMTLAKNAGTVDVKAHVADAAVNLLRSGTQFWLRGANPNLSDPSSLTAVVAGPTIVMQPGPGKPATHFVGLARKPVISGPHGPPQIYGVALPGSVGELKPGEPVKLRGFTVGEVKDIGFHYDAAKGEFTTPVTLALYPSLFHVGEAAAQGGHGALTQAIDQLVGKGLRARLERDPPLVGTPEVTLDIVPGAPAAQPTVANGVPQIPAAPGGGINSIVARVNKVPIDQIAQNLLDTTHHLDALVASPELADAIAQLDATLKQVHATAGSAGPKITTLVDSLKRTAGQIDDAAKSADKVLGGTPNQDGTQQAMREITEAARSIRELADYLDRHPEALVQGRSGP